MFSAILTGKLFRQFIFLQIINQAIPIVVFIVSLKKIVGNPSPRCLRLDEDPPFFQQIYSQFCKFGEPLCLK